MALDYTIQSEEELSKLLAYEDQRIRMKAQFELARRGKSGEEVFKRSAGGGESRFKRIHAIWGLGQMIARGECSSDFLMGLLDDGDAEIVAQSAKVLGDVRAKSAGSKLLRALKTSSDPRIEFFTSQALGRIKYTPAISALIGLLQDNDDGDLYIRHAAVLALARMGAADEMLALQNDESKPLRTAAILVLRRLQHPGLARFLHDSDEYVVTEAARAIHDDWSVEDALPDLADLLNITPFSSEPLVRRILSACQRLGDEKYLDAVLEYSQKSGVSLALKEEALAIIGTWAKPSVLDRVDGRYRGEIVRDSMVVAQKIKPHIRTMLKDHHPTVVEATSRLLANLGINSFEKELARIFRSKRSGALRAAILEDLSALKSPNLENLVEQGMRDTNIEVRSTALGMVDRIEMNGKQLESIANTVFTTGSVREQQQLLRVLGKKPLPDTKTIFEDLLSKRNSGVLDPAIVLDLMEAIDSSGSADLQAQVRRQGEDSLLDRYGETLVGGSRREGWRIFNRHASAQCTRCHSLSRSEHELTAVGPNLGNIGNELSREEILEALIEPSARIAPGFGSVLLSLADESTLQGILLLKDEEELIIKANNPEPIRVRRDRIVKEENLPSSMPPVGSFLTRREIRDLVEFLSGLKEEEM